MYQIRFDQWYKLGSYLGLTKDQLEEAKKSPHPTGAVLLAAKVRNIDLTWGHIVEALLNVGDQKLAESIYNEQGECVCTGTCQHGQTGVHVWPALGSG